VNGCAAMRDLEAGARLVAFLNRSTEHRRDKSGNALPVALPKVRQNECRHAKLFRESEWFQEQAAV
jgi:hypothetical protein